MSQTPSSPFDSAIAELGSVLGPEHVITNPNVLSDYESATFETSAQIAMVVLPADCAQVQAIVRIAARHRLPLYPVSRGRNWGMGSRVPCGTNHCVVDLQRMNRIVDYDPVDATMTIEPGVTFQQVADFLEERQSDLFLATIGGPSDASVLANTLERGDALGPVGERARYCCGLQVVLPSGELLRTGFDAYAGSLVGKTAPYGLGPALEGLFFQSNLGIVTRMNVWLARKPHSFRVFMFGTRSEAQIDGAMAAVRGLQQRGVVGDTSCSVWNIYRFATTQMTYPWQAGQPLASPKELLARLPRAWRGTKWVGFVGVYSPSALHGWASEWLVRKALRGKVSRLTVVSPLRAWLGRALRRPLSRLTGIDVGKLLDNMYFHSVFLGHPNTLGPASTYWRKRVAIANRNNPDRDRCGLHWVCVALPFAGEHVAKVTNVVEEVALGHDLEPMCMFFNMSQWYMKSFIVIMFDRDAPGEEERARSCHDQILARLTGAGYPPVRLGIQSMHLGAPTDQVYVDLVRDLKRAIDPEDIMAPGRYDFRQGWTPTR
jgi:4-cresol dehydrogenase (hydroxylating) flavoprotein subunit